MYRYRCRQRLQPWHKIKRYLKVHPLAMQLAVVRPSLFLPLSLSPSLSLSCFSSCPSSPRVTSTVHKLYLLLRKSLRLLARFSASCTKISCRIYVVRMCTTRRDLCGIDKFDMQSLNTLTKGTTCSWACKSSFKKANLKEATQRGSQVARLFFVKFDQTPCDNVHTMPKD